MAITTVSTVIHYISCGTRLLRYGDQYWCKGMRSFGRHSVTHYIWYIWYWYFSSIYLMFFMDKMLLLWNNDLGNTIPGNHFYSDCGTWGKAWVCKRLPYRQINSTVGTVYWLPCSYHTVTLLHKYIGTF